MESHKSLDVAVEIEVSLDHGSRTALYQQIFDCVWCDVIDGTLEPGQRLPTVRQLAVNLGVHLKENKTKTKTKTKSGGGGEE